MNYSFTYVVTAAMQDASLHEYYFYVLIGRRALLLALIAILLSALLILQAPVWCTASLAAGLLIILALWIRVYFSLKSQGRAGLRLMEHPNIEVIVTDESIQYSSSTGTRIHRWNKIDMIVETKNFVVIFNGKIPLLILPKYPISVEQLNFMRSKVVVAGAGRGRN